MRYLKGLSILKYKRSMTEGYWKKSKKKKRKERNGKEVT
jgi:hypothetical protein